MNLQVPLRRQNKDSVDCGPTCLSMMLNYYGINKSVEQITKEITVFKGMGTYIPQLGSYMISQGFEVEIITMNPHLFLNKHKGMSQKQILDYLQQTYSTIKRNPKQKKFLRPLEYFIKFLKDGGKIKIKIPEISDMANELKARRPLFALVTTNFLLFDKPKFNFHFNVVTGLDNKYVYVNDPMWDKRGGKHKYPIRDYIYALYSNAYGDLDNASLMMVKKKK